MIGWATLAGPRARVAHAWFSIPTRPHSSWRSSACGTFKKRADLADGEHPEGRRCRNCVRELKRDYKRKRGGAIY